MRHLAAVFLMAFPFLVLPLNASGQEMSAAEIIRSAVSAGPASISDDAAVWDWNMNEIRPGTNGWTCLPDRADTEGNDPWCLDAHWLDFLNAYVNQIEPKSFKLEFDHANILVRDLGESGHFYSTILQLEELETPWGPNPSVRSFAIGGNQQLHVAQVGGEGVVPNKVVHMAFAIGEFDAYLAFLKEEGIEYSNFAGDSIDPQIRPDGVRQIYFQDPDGNWIEINDARY